MNAPSKAKLLTRRVIHLTQRILFRLRWFPFTLFLLLLNALFMQLRRRLLIIPVGEALGETQTLLRDAMLWLDSVPAAPPYHQLEVCFRLSSQAANANLHDLFSATLAFPRFRSIGLYWDSASLADDLLLWQGTSKSGDPARRVTPYDLAASGAARLQEFLHADHKEIALPVAASRDAETFIKRRAGAAWVACLNLAPEQGSLADILAAARPDIWFFDFSTRSSKEAGAPNYQSVFDHGLTLHERMAVVLAADAYVGNFDELGCAALISGRRTVLVGGGTSSQRDRISRSQGAVWFPGRLEPTTLATEVLQFLSRLHNDPRDCPE